MSATRSSRNLSNGRRGLYSLGSSCHGCGPGFGRGLGGIGLGSSCHGCGLGFGRGLGGTGLGSSCHGCGLGFGRGLGGTGLGSSCHGCGLGFGRGLGGTGLGSSCHGCGLGFGRGLGWLVAKESLIRAMRSEMPFFFFLTAVATLVLRGIVRFLKTRPLTSRRVALLLRRFLLLFLNFEGRFTVVPPSTSAGWQFS